MVMAMAPAPESGNVLQSTEEMALKKNTDCVYFLASPLTCKKGNDCEFRHSEAARINPRDCWYWPLGTCLNKDCPFRHPPMDVRSSPSPAPAPTPSAPAAANNSKGRTACYFFNQGYCSKGDRCSFLHGVPSLQPVVQAPPPQAKPEPVVDKEAIRTEPATKPAAVKQQQQPVVKKVVKPQQQQQQQVIKQQHQQQTVVKQTVLEQVKQDVIRPSEVPQVTKIAVSRPPPVRGRNGMVEVDMRPAEDLESNGEEEDESPTATRGENADGWDESSPGFDVLVDGPEDGGEGEYEDAGRHYSNEADDFGYEYSELSQGGGPAAGYEPGEHYVRQVFDQYEQPGYDHNSFEPRDFDRPNYDTPFDHIDYERLERPRLVDHPAPRDEYVRRVYSARPEQLSIRDRLNFNTPGRRPYLENGDLRNLLEKRRRLDSMERERYRRDRSVQARDLYSRSQGEEYRDRARRHQQQHQHYPVQNAYRGSSNGRRSRERSQHPMDAVGGGGRRFDSAPAAEVNEHLVPKQARSSSGAAESRHAHRQQQQQQPQQPQPQPQQQGFGRRSDGSCNSDFDAPKTLAQIRAEKRKFQDLGNGGAADSENAGVFKKCNNNSNSSLNNLNSSGPNNQINNSNNNNTNTNNSSFNNNNNSSWRQGFSSPKPLSELLKEKRKVEEEVEQRVMANGGDNNNTNIATEDATAAAAAEDDYLSDDDDFAQKLSSYFSTS